MSKWNSDSTVVDGVAEVVDDRGTSGEMQHSGGVCHWGGTFRNPCFWVLIGVGATLAFQYFLSQKSTK